MSLYFFKKLDAFLRLFYLENFCIWHPIVLVRLRLSLTDCLLALILFRWFETKKKKKNYFKLLWFFFSFSTLNCFIKFFLDKNMKIFIAFMIHIVNNQPTSSKKKELKTHTISSSSNYSKRDIVVKRLYLRKEICLTLKKFMFYFLQQKKKN